MDLFIDPSYIRTHGFNIYSDHQNLRFKKPINFFFYFFKLKFNTCKNPLTNLWDLLNIYFNILTSCRGDLLLLPRADSIFYIAIYYLTRRGLWVTMVKQHSISSTEVAPPISHVSIPPQCPTDIIDVVQAPGVECSHYHDTSLELTDYAASGGSIRQPKWKYNCIASSIKAERSISSHYKKVSLT